MLTAKTKTSNICAKTVATRPKREQCSSGGIYLHSLIQKLSGMLEESLTLEAFLKAQAWGRKWRTITCIVRALAKLYTCSNNEVPSRWAPVTVNCKIMSFLYFAVHYAIHFKLFDIGQHARERHVYRNMERHFFPLRIPIEVNGNWKGCCSCVLNRSPRRAIL